ncbi:uncharacterized protein TEOVI_000431100 [Trypanosoma equiperdum]|uniref:Uncharacterized protein n=1 Tax=Trypanosoma equiperdum TaxID=5694 RepID=A0A1G4IK72_TRYEQ|nr:hypothetical protein TEOVI_000431100 [Trypanosoma equiperdum]
MSYSVCRCMYCCRCAEKLAHSLVVRFGVAVARVHCGFSNRVPQRFWRIDAVSVGLHREAKAYVRYWVVWSDLAFLIAFCKAVSPALRIAGFVKLAFAALAAEDRLEQQLVYCLLFARRCRGLLLPQF